MGMTLAKVPALCGLALGLALSAPLHAAEIYKWVDEDGVTHYSQRPPPSGDAARIGVDRPPDKEIARERREMKQTGERIEERREQRQEAEQQARKDADQREQREARCADLRSSLTKLTRNRRLLIPDDEGNVRRMPEEERKERVAERRRQIEEQCE